MSRFQVGGQYRLLSTAAAIAFTVSPAVAAPIEIRTPNIINVPGATSVTLNGVTFTNSGLQGMARIPAGTPDFNGDSFGAFSGMDLNLSAWRKTDAGYTGVLYALPDRGPNGIGTVGFSDYAGRTSAFNLAFTPYTGTANLPVATTSQNQMVLTANGGIIFRDFNGNVTTGFDPGTGAASVITQNGIPLPGQSTGAAANKIALDAEAIRFLNDGTFYVSDEYGANVYYFNAAGRLTGVIRPPSALIPRDAAGNTSYSSLVAPATGRRPNQGLEGMAITPDGKKLVTLLQSGAIQDSSGGQQDRSNTRLMIYDITANKTPTAPVADYVMQLPIFQATGNGGAPNRTAAQSEILALNDTQFLVLSRDGNGLGTGNDNPVYKSILLVDTSGATNIAGTNFETTNAPISTGVNLNPAIRPVQYVELVNMLNATQLGKFGENLNNVAPTRLTLAEKWEGLALAPVLEESAPNDYFLMVGNDNDFLSSTCRVNGQDCAQAVNSDAHVLIYRLTLPTYVDPQYRLAMVNNGPLMVGTVAQAGYDVARIHDSNVIEHLSSLRRAGWSAGTTSGWVLGAYDDGDADKFTAANTPAKSNTFRGTMGVDIGVTDDVSFGLAFGYGETELESGAGFQAKADGFSYGAAVRYFKDGFFGHVGYSRGNFDGEDIRRPAAYGLTANGETDGDGESVFIEGGKSFEMSSMRLTPFGGFRYTFAKFDAFTETGAAGGNIAVPEIKNLSRVGYAGLEAEFPMERMTPYVTVAYNKEFEDDARTLPLTLASVSAVPMATENVIVPELNEDSITAGLGLQGGVGKALWHAGYQAEIGMDDRLVHQFRFGIGFQF